MSRAAASSSPDADDDGFSHTQPLRATLGEDAAGARFDKALAAALEPESAVALGLSRTRLRSLIEAGAVRVDGAPARDPARKMTGGELCEIDAPPPAPLDLVPETIPLDIAYEDADLLVVAKPAGMAVHPAPGAETGTLVHALLAHCGDGLSGVGGALRPGIVHRIDKDTSGLLVVAKSDRAHAGLSSQFAAHSVERLYQALVWGAPDRGDPRLMGLPSVSVVEGRFRIETELARAKFDRKKMAVVRSGGKRAVTWITPAARFVGAKGKSLAALVECRLETGRTHQIRVHMAHVGHPLLGDPIYGRAQASRIAAIDDADLAAALAKFDRQALHAAILGFVHPVSGETLRFEQAPPQDFADLLSRLNAFSAGS